MVAEFVSDFQKWQCFFCGYLYDEAAGDPEEGIAPGTRWDDIPADWLPGCRRRGSAASPWKSAFSEATRPCTTPADLRTTSGRRYDMSDALAGRGPTAA